MVSVIEFVRDLLFFAGYRTAKEKEWEHRQVEESVKHREATRRMKEFLTRHERMSIAGILDELEQMHEFHAVAVWTNWGNAFYELIAIASFQKSLPLKTSEVVRMVNMLLWPEFRRFQDRRAPCLMLSIASENPSREFLPILLEHRVWLDKQYASIEPRDNLGTSPLAVASETGYVIASGHRDWWNYLGGMAQEIALTESLVNACEAS